MKTGIELIKEERDEQFFKHGYRPIDDVQYNEDAQLRIAAVRLIQDRNNADAPDGWNKKTWEKMLAKQLKQRLIIAGALIAAEIDRINLIEINTK